MELNLGPMQPMTGATPAIAQSEVDRLMNIVKFPFRRKMAKEATENEALVAAFMHKTLGLRGKAPENPGKNGHTAKTEKRNRVFSVVARYNGITTAQLVPKLPELTRAQIQHYLVELRKEGRLRSWMPPSRGGAVWRVAG